MKLFRRMKDGGPESHVDGYFLVEFKPLFSVVLLKFNKGTREAFHSHAFNAITLWLKGKAKEHILDSEGGRVWTPGEVKRTSRDCFHKVEALENTWALSFRGPWADIWREHIEDKYITLTHGRKVVNVTNNQAQ